MKAVEPSTDPEVLAFRKRVGADQWDEMWEGVLHMLPSPTPEHQDFEGALEAWLRRHWARRKGYKVYHNVNVAPAGGWQSNYRIPDVLLFGPEARAVNKGAYFEGPPDVVVEIHSPGDKAFEKLPFYAALGVREAWIIDRDNKTPRIYELRGETLEPKAPDADGWMRSAFTGVELRAAGGGKLSIRLRGDESTLENLPGE